MTTSGIFVGFFNAPVLFVFWLTMHTVDSDLLSTPEVVKGAYGKSVTVSCQYDHQFRDNQKYWCRGKVYDLCRIVVRTPMNQNSDRCSIADNMKAGVFTVHMTSLRQSDADIYWCVISRHGRNIYTPVKLLISHTDLLQLVTPWQHQTSSNTKPPDSGEIRWWATLRWFLFILMLCCLVSIYINEWRIKKRKQLHQQLQHQVIYENVTI